MSGTLALAGGRGRRASQTEAAPGPGGERGGRGPGTLVKFCGLSCLEDVRAANRALPDFAGFVVDYPPSRRSVAGGALGALRDALDSRIAAVGVFVDRDPAFVAALARSCALDYLQLHGGEGEDYLDTLRALGAPPAIKAFVVRGEGQLRGARSSSAAFVLLDGGKGGGAGFDWELARGLQRPFFLGGGVNAGNAGRAVCELRPFALDVSSGIETDGRKDRAKMEAFIEAVKSADEAFAGSAGGDARGDGSDRKGLSAANREIQNGEERR